MSEQNYPRNHQHVNWLRQRLMKELPEPTSNFAQLYRQTLTQGVLDAKVKELIALGIAVYTLNEDCVASHVHDAMRAGATRHEILETLSVAALMGGEPAVLASCAAFAALEQFAIELAEEQAAQRAGQ
jgi:AhpD family alkylhydroperoxidase